MICIECPISSKRNAYMSDQTKKNFKTHLIIISLGILIGLMFLFYEPVSKKIDESISEQDIREMAMNKFAPHRAVYSIKMASKRSGSQIVNISGKMYYDWKPTCEGWLSDHRFIMRYEYADAPAMRITSNFSTFEAYDGSSLSFTSERKNNGELFEQIRGKADKTAADFIKPEKVTQELPEGILFPSAHTVHVARQIERGQFLEKAVIFDGSDMEGPVEVTSTVIKRDIKPDYSSKSESDVDLNLLKDPAHKIRLAFFPITDDTAMKSDYEMDLVFHNNGVISGMHIDYEDFSVDQKLIALEKIDSQCETID